MHHRTTLGLPSTEAREADRELLSDQIAMFIAAGGEVERLAITDRKPEAKGNLRDRAHTQLHLSRNSRRELERKDKDLAVRASALAAAGLSAERIRKKIALGPVAFEQFMARHGIPLPARKTS